MFFLKITGFVFVALYLIFLIVMEDKIICHPVKYPEGYRNAEIFGLMLEDVYFESKDGTKLHGWYVAAKNPKATILWFHGNAGNITHRLENIRLLHQLNVNIFIFDYRGYGRSHGKPSEKGLYLDSLVACDWLVDIRKTLKTSLILFGRSLGGVCAVEIARQRHSAGLILESTFTSAKDMAKKMFPHLPLEGLVFSKFDSLTGISDVRMPILFFHGIKDEIVPYFLAKKLFKAAPEPKRFYDIEGAGHNDTYHAGGRDYFKSIETFINQISPAVSRKDTINQDNEIISR